MRKRYHVRVTKKNDDDTEKYRNEYIISVDDQVDWDNQKMIRSCIVFKSDSKPDVYDSFDISKSDSEEAQIKEHSLDLRDYYRRDNPDITVTEIDISETKRYRGMAKKSNPKGELVYLHEYKFWVSNSEYETYPRTYTAVGPRVADDKTHGLLEKGEDEAKHLKNLLESWHSDADVIELILWQP